MRAMPSPTSRTRPTSWTLSFSLYWSISSRRTETISSGLNRMAASLDKFGPHRLQARADAGVVEEIADPDDQAAEDFGVHLQAQDRLAAERLAELPGQPLAVLV